MRPDPATAGPDPLLADFVQGHVQTAVAGWERDHVVPFDAAREMIRQGILRVVGPGAADRMTQRMHLATLLGRTGSIGTAVTLLHATGAPLSILFRLARDRLHHGDLAPLLRGRSTAAVAYGHPSVGRLFGSKRSGSIRLNGSFSAVNVPGADLVVVAARDTSRREASGWLVIVPLDAEGVSVRRLHTFGLRTAAVADVEVRDCRLPSERVVARLSDAASVLEESLAEERLELCSALLALVDGVVDRTLTFVGARDFGPGEYLGDLQVVRHRLADLVADYEMVESLYREVVGASSVVEPDDRPRVAMAREACGRMALRVVEGCVQLLGSRGFMADNPAGRAYQDCLTMPMVAGAEPASLRRATWAGKPRSYDLPGGENPTDRGRRGPRMGSDSVRSSTSSGDAVQASPVCPPMGGSTRGTRNSLVDSVTHERFRARVDRLMRDVVVPNLPEWERVGSIPRELFRMWGEAGLLGFMVPETAGGGGLDFSYGVLEAEELMALGATGVAASIMVQSNVLCPLLLRYGSRELQTEFLGALARGDLIGAVGATEPSGGSALLDTLTCTAEADGDEWVISGEKMFITNGPIADVVLVLARTAHGRGPFTTTIVLVPTDAAGFEVVAQHEKLGLHASPTGHLRFDRCRVPRRYTVGRAGFGFPELSWGVCQERLLVGIGSIACARATLDHTIMHLTDGLDARTPSSPAARLAVDRCVEWSIDVAAGRAFGHRVAADVCNGRVRTAQTAMAKFALCDMAQRIIQRCGELRGARALCDDAWMQKVLRDMRVVSVFAGSSETMREMYGNALMRRTHR